MVALSGTLLVYNKSVRQSMTFYLFPEVTLAFQNELLVSSSTMPSLINLWYLV
jgi:hypothetical protein